MKRSMEGVRGPTLDRGACGSTTAPNTKASTIASAPPTPQILMENELDTTELAESPQLATTEPATTEPELATTEPATTTESLQLATTTDSPELATTEPATTQPDSFNDVFDSFVCATRDVADKGGDANHQSMMGAIVGGACDQYIANAVGM